MSITGLFVSLAACHSDNFKVSVASTGYFRLRFLMINTLVYDLIMDIVSELLFSLNCPISVLEAKKYQYMSSIGFSTFALP